MLVELLAAASAELGTDDGTVGRGRASRCRPSRRRGPSSRALRRGRVTTLSHAHADARRPARARGPALSSTGDRRTTAYIGEVLSATSSSIVLSAMTQEPARSPASGATARYADSPRPRSRGRSARPSSASTPSSTAPSRSPAIACGSPPGLLDVARPASSCWRRALPGLARATCSSCRTRWAGASPRPCASRSSTSVHRGDATRSRAIESLPARAPARPDRGSCTVPRRGHRPLRASAGELAPGASKPAIAGQALACLAARGSCPA